MSHLISTSRFTRTLFWKTWRRFFRGLNVSDEFDVSFCLKDEKLNELLHCGDLSLCLLLFCGFFIPLHPCLTHQHIYIRNTLHLIHLYLKANHYYQDLKAINQKIWFCFLENNWSANCTISLWSFERSFDVHDENVCS